MVGSGLDPSGHMLISSHPPSWDTVTDQKSREASTPCPAEGLGSCFLSIVINLSQNGRMYLSLIRA